FIPVERGTQRTEQYSARIRDSAAEHDDLRIQDVDEAGEGDAKRPDRPIPHRYRFRRTPADGESQFLSGQKPALATTAQSTFTNRIFQAPGRIDDVEHTVW